MNFNFLTINELKHNLLVSQTANRVQSKYFISYLKNVHHRLRRMRSDVGKSRYSFVDRCLRQVIPDMLQCTF